MKLSLALTLLPAVTLAVPLLEFPEDASLIDDFKLNHTNTSHTINDLHGRDECLDISHWETALLKETERLAFEAPLSDFTTKHYVQDPKTLSWESLGCYMDYEYWNTVNFNAACDRWNFAVQNYVIQGRWDVDVKKRAVDAFERDLEYTCDQATTLNKDTCKRQAFAMWLTVRRWDGYAQTPFPLNKEKLCQNKIQNLGTG